MSTVKSFAEANINVVAEFSFHECQGTVCDLEEVHSA